MKIDVINMLHSAAIQARNMGGAHSYALLELANNLRLLMRGDESLEDWNKVYVGQDRAPIDIETMLPEDAE